MKNATIFLIFSILSSFTCLSQTSTGNRYLAGNLRFGSDKTKPENGNPTQTNNFDARAELGRFIYDDLAFGGALQIERSANPTGSKNRKFNPQLLGVARYYAGKGTAKIFLAGELGLSLLHSSYLTYVGTAKEKREGATQIGGAYGIGAGLAWFLRPGIAVEGQMGWEGYSLPKSKSNVSFTGLKVGVSAYLDAAESKTHTTQSKMDDQAVQGSSKKQKNDGKYSDYGGKIGIGFSIFDGFGVPVRFYFSPKQVLEGGIYYGGIVVNTDNGPELQTSLMLGGGFTFFGNRFEKESKKKIRAHGLALRVNYLTGDYSTTMLSAGWAMETFRESSRKHSFIFELGLRGQFPNFEINGEAAKPTPTAYLRCHWNFFVK